MTTSAQAIDRIVDALATLTAALGDAHPEAAISAREPVLHRLDRAVSRARALALLSPDLRLCDELPDTYFDPIDEADHLLAVEELRQLTTGPLEPVNIQIVIDGGSTVLGGALARNLIGQHVARPVNGRLELDLTRQVAAVVCKMGAAPEAVVEEAMDVVDDPNEDEVFPDSSALTALRRVYSQRY